MTLREVADRFHAHPHGKGYEAFCPVHEDPGTSKSRSLSIDPGRDGVLLKCQSRGCAVEDICAASGLALADLFYTPRNGERQAEARVPPSIVAVYPYTDACGATLYEAVRFHPKDFRQRRSDGNGGWVWNTKGVRKVLYRLADLQGQTAVYVVEGEKDADALWALGLPATTNVGGAGKWLPEYVAQLQEAGVTHAVTFPDNDPPGATHSRQVADGCWSGGLKVKLVPLPGLPPKGDVSDYLQTHTAADLVAVVKAAPLYDPHASVTASPLALTTLTDFLLTADTPIDYVVEDRIPAGSISLFCAPPKTGKSTATRGLALAVAQGVPWCGWRTTPGPVWLFAFEDQPSEVRRHFVQMGARGDEPVRLFIGAAPSDLLGHLQAQALVERPRLIVIDHLGHVLGAKDYNDYAQVTTKFAPLLALARDSGAALVLNYHASSHAEREGISAVLGSTAIAASVDNIFVLKRAEHQRILSSVQRIGPSLEPTVIELDAATGWFETLGTKHQRDAHALGDRIMEVLRAEGPMGEATLKSRVEGRGVEKERILRKLVRMGWVERTGLGKSQNPYLYGISGRETEGAEGDVWEGDSVSEKAEGDIGKRKNAGSSTYVRTSEVLDEPPLFDPKGWTK